MKKIFTEIYDLEKWGKGKGSGAGSSFKFNKEYIEFIEHFLIDMGIESVIDYGCGDWQFSQHINWGDTKYLGLDIVDSVIEKNKEQFPNYDFVSDTNVFKYLEGKDLIIIKDVIMHWTDDVIIEFLDKLMTYDIQILLVNASNQKSKRRIRGIGGFSPLSNNQYPLNKYDGELIFEYNGQQVVKLNGMDL